MFFNPSHKGHSAKLKESVLQRQDSGTGSCTCCRLRVGLEAVSNFEAQFTVCSERRMTKQNAEYLIENSSAFAKKQVDPAVLHCEPSQASRPFPFRSQPTKMHLRTPGSSFPARCVHPRDLDSTLTHTCHPSPSKASVGSFL